MSEFVDPLKVADGWAMNVRDRRRREAAKRQMQSKPLTERQKRFSRGDHDTRTAEAITRLPLKP